jgi:hypothetical protein
MRDEEKPAIPKEIAPPVVDDWNKKDGHLKASLISR